jgi:hypothetical protein
MKFLLTAATTWLLLQASGHPLLANDYARQAATYSATAGLDPVATVAVREIRVWAPETLIRPTVGWIITRDRIVVYSGESRLKPVRTFQTSKARKVLRAFENLRPYDGQWLTCSRMKDGWSLIVESSISSGQFAFSSSSPKLCTTGGAHEVWLAYNLLREATRGAP